MKAINCQAGAFQLSKVDVMDTSGPAFCTFDGCYGMALQRLLIAGHPAGFVCADHGRELLGVWVEMSPDHAPARMAA